MTAFLSEKSRVRTYLIFPRFLLETPVNETAKLLYMLLLDRARLSSKNPEWTDDKGRVFLIFPISKLAAALHKSETTVKTALSDLEKADLIRREHQGIGKPNRLYVRIPAAGELPAPETETCPRPGQNPVCHEDGKLSGSKNKRVITMSKKEESKSLTMAYGTYQNVFLTAEEYKDLREKIRDLPGRINRLSEYMNKTGRTYSDHASTLLSWAEKDGKLIPRRNYDYQEGESL